MRALVDDRAECLRDRREWRVRGRPGAGRGDSRVSGGRPAMLLGEAEDEAATATIAGFAFDAVPPDLGPSLEIGVEQRRIDAIAAQRLGRGGPGGRGRRE